MNFRSLVFLGLLALVACARSENRIITTTGKYTGGAGRMTINIAALDQTHLIVAVISKAKTRNGTLIERRSGPGVATVAAEKWAFCFTKDELWFYDGGAIFTVYDATDALSGLCSDKTLGARAPALLKAWVEKSRNSR
jgi:hypothetical protein